MAVVAVASEYEILIGDTNRTASATALENTDGDSWCVELVGNRIVIQASFDWLLEDALAYFQTLCTVVDGTVMLDTSLCKTVTRSFLLGSASAGSTARQRAHSKEVSNLEALRGSGELKFLRRLSC